VTFWGQLKRKRLFLNKKHCSVITLENIPVDDFFVSLSLHVNMSIYSIKLNVVSLFNLLYLLILEYRLFKKKLKTQKYVILIGRRIVQSNLLKKCKFSSK